MSFTYHIIKYEDIYGKLKNDGSKVRSLITKDVALIWLPVLVGDCHLLSFVISERTLCMLQ